MMNTKPIIFSLDFHETSRSTRKMPFFSQKVTPIKRDTFYPSESLTTRTSFEKSQKTFYHHSRIFRLNQYSELMRCTLYKEEVRNKVRQLSVRQIRQLVQQFKKKVNDYLLKQEFKHKVDWL